LGQNVLGEARYEEYNHDDQQFPHFYSCAASCLACGWLAKLQHKTVSFAANGRIEYGQSSCVSGVTLAERCSH
jgi:hypothetical protein